MEHIPWLHSQQSCKALPDSCCSSTVRHVEMLGRELLAQVVFPSTKKREARRDDIKLLRLGYRRSFSRGQRNKMRKYIQGRQRGLAYK